MLDPSLDASELANWLGINIASIRKAISNIELQRHQIAALFGMELDDIDWMINARKQIRIDKKRQRKAVIQAEKEEARVTKEEAKKEKKYRKLNSEYRETNPLLKRGQMFPKNTVKRKNQCFKHTTISRQKCIKYLWPYYSRTADGKYEFDDKTCGKPAGIPKFFKLNSN